MNHRLEIPAYCTSRANIPALLMLSFLIVMSNGVFALSSPRSLPNSSDLAESTKDSHLSEQWYYLQFGAFDEQENGEALFQYLQRYYDYLGMNHRLTLEVVDDRYILLFGPFYRDNDPAIKTIQSTLKKSERLATINPTLIALPSMDPILSNGYQIAIEAISETQFQRMKQQAILRANNIDERTIHHLINTYTNNDPNHYLSLSYSPNLHYRFIANEERAIIEERNDEGEYQVKTLIDDSAIISQEAIADHTIRLSVNYWLDDETPIIERIHPQNSSAPLNGAQVSYNSSTYCFNANKNLHQLSSDSFLYHINETRDKRQFEKVDCVQLTDQINAIDLKRGGVAKAQPISTIEKHITFDPDELAMANLTSMTVDSITYPLHSYTPIAYFPSEAIILFSGVEATLEPYSLLSMRYIPDLPYNRAYSTNRQFRAGGQTLDPMFSSLATYTIEAKRAPDHASQTSEQRESHSAENPFHSPDKQYHPIFNIQQYIDEQLILPFFWINDDQLLIKTDKHAYLITLTKMD